MKKVLYTGMSAFAMAMMFASCDKETVTPKAPEVDTTKKNTAAPTFTPTILDINGSLVALKTKTTMSQAGMSIDTEIETAIATFYNGATLVDAGTVSVNGFELSKQTNNSYLKAPSATSVTTDLKFATSANWSVSGSSNASAISYNYTGGFPEYKGDVPTSITKANGLSFTFNTTTVKNADSVYVFIATSNGTTFTKAFGANAGSVSISAGELSNLPTATNNSAFLEVIPVTYTLQTFASRRYAFIKEQACVKNVNIN